MELKIIHNEELVKNPIKFLIRNFDLVEDGEKLFIKYSIDKEKEMRIFFKNTLLNAESRENIKQAWGNEETAELLLDNLWLVKSNSSGVLLLVPLDQEVGLKDGVFVLVISKLFSYPTPIYFKRSYITSNSIGVFKLVNKSMIFLMGSNKIILIVNKNSDITLKTYVEF